MEAFAKDAVGRLLWADAAKLPFDDGSFDLVLSTLSLHHWSQPLECLTEVHRVLKPQHEAWIYDARRDTTKEVNAAFRRKYGWFLAVLFLKLVRAHSSVTLHEVETLLRWRRLQYPFRAHTCVTKACSLNCSS
jgi:ubiquinone/menaquinone biosynthesis C-methylase UbiE